MPTNVLSVPSSEAPEVARARARALVRRMAGGDEEALGELYTLYARPLGAIARRILHSDSGAEIEEVLQDAFLRAWKHAGSYDPERAAPFGWLVLITRRLCLDRVRKTARRPILIGQNWEQVVETQDKVRGTDSVSPHSPDKEAVRRSLQSLPASQRQCLEMAFFEGRSHSEIATALKRPLGSVKSDVRRAMLRLREVFSHDPS